MTANDGNILVTVRRRRGDWRQAVYRLADIHGLAINGVSRLRELTGRVWSDAASVRGEPLEPQRGAERYQFEVAILWEDNPDGMEFLSDRAAANAT